MQWKISVTLARMVRATWVGGAGGTAMHSGIVTLPTFVGFLFCIWSTSLICLSDLLNCMGHTFLPSAACRVLCPSLRNNFPPPTLAAQAEQQVTDSFLCLICDTGMCRIRLKANGLVGLPHWLFCVHASPLWLPASPYCFACSPWAATSRGNWGDPSSSTAATNAQGHQQHPHQGTLTWALVWPNLQALVAVLFTHKTF